MRTYRYIFYRVYCWARQLHGGRDHPAHTTLWTMSLLAGANLLSLSMLVAVFAPLPFAVSKDTAKVIGAGVILIIAGMHFRTFVQRDSTLELVAEFEERNPMIGRRADLIVRAYTFGSVIFFVVLGLSIALWRAP